MFLFPDHSKNEKKVNNDGKTLATYSSDYILIWPSEICVYPFFMNIEIILRKET